MEVFNTCKLCDSNITEINETYNLYQCTSCKIIFCKTKFTQEDFIKTYNALYNEKNSIYARHSVDEYNKIKKGEKISVGRNRGNLILKHIFKKKNASVIEIGSGIGLVGYYIQRNCPSAVYEGIEIDKKAFEKSKSLGLDTYHADFSFLEANQKQYDVLMLWEVIEHLQDLKLFLSLAKKSISKGGSIILSTPNYEKIYNYPEREKDSIFQNTPPVHLNFFTKANITNIFQEAGFKNVKVSIKKFPYFEPTNFRFYKNVFKAIIGRYNGPTIYLEAYNT